MQIPNTQAGTPTHNEKPVSLGEATTTTEKTTTSQLVRPAQEEEREKEHVVRTFRGSNDKAVFLSLPSHSSNDF
jgi:hypothetical protein